MEISRPGITPQELQRLTAHAYARLIVDYCHPALHEYFVSIQADDIFEELSLREDGQHTKDMCLTRHQLVKYLKNIHSFYWNDLSYCLGNSESVLRELVSYETLSLMNYSQDYILAPLVKFTIQVLFCSEAGEFFQQDLRISCQSKCMLYANFLKEFAPHINLRSVDTLYLKFCSLSPLLELLKNSRNLKRISLNHTNMCPIILQSVAQKCFELEELTMENGQEYFGDSNLCTFFFSGRQKDSLHNDIRQGAEIEVTFPKLKKFYVTTSSTFSRRPFTGSQFTTFCLLYCYPNLVTNFGSCISYSNVQALSRYIQPPPFLRGIGVCKMDYLKFEEPNPTLNYSLNDFTSCSLFKTLSLIAQPQWYVEHIDLLTDLIRGLNCSSLDFTILSVRWHSYNSLYSSQIFNILFDDIGPLLQELTLHISNCSDIKQILISLNKCPNLSKVSINLLDVFLKDLNKEIDEELKPLHKLRTLTFSGTYDRYFLSASPFCNKILRATPNLEYLSLQHDMVSCLQNLDAIAATKIHTLHLRESQTFGGSVLSLISATLLSSTLRRLVIEDVPEEISIVAKDAFKRTEVEVVHGQRYSFSRCYTQDIREIKY